MARPAVLLTLGPVLFFAATTGSRGDVGSFLGGLVGFLFASIGLAVALLALNKKLKPATKAALGAAIAVLVVATVAWAVVNWPYGGTAAIVAGPPGSPSPSIVPTSFPPATSTSPSTSPVDAPTTTTTTTRSIPPDPPLPPVLTAQSPPSYPYTVDFNKALDCQSGCWAVDQMTTKLVSVVVIDVGQVDLHVVFTNATSDDFSIVFDGPDYLSDNVGTSIAAYSDVGGTGHIPVLAHSSTSYTMSFSGLHPGAGTMCTFESNVEQGGDFTIVYADVSVPCR